MKPLILMFTVHLLWLKGCQGAPTSKDTADIGENLKSLSVVGEKYVDEEVKKALMGIKQMKIMMERSEVKHKELMKTLKKSSKEKQEAFQLMNEVKERLEEEERQCQVSLTDLWDECKSCLKSSCMRFYTTCQPSWSTVINKIESFFKKIPQLIFPFHEDEAKALPVIGKPDKEDAQLSQMEGAFSQLSMDVNTLFNRSTDVFKQICQEFDQAFQTYFISDPDLTKPYFLPSFSETTPQNTSLLKSWEIPNFLQLFFDFSKSVFIGISEMITEMLKGMRDLPEQVKELNKGGMFSKIFPGHDRAPCKELGQNLSGCLEFHERCQKCKENLLQDCPDVPELHLKFDEAFQLFNISEQQYNQIFQITQHHMEDMTSMMWKMREKFGWVTELAHRTLGSENIFSIIKVAPRIGEGKTSNPNNTLVEVTILTSPAFIIKVPQDVSMDNSNFIEYVVGKALQYYKQHV
ncbi:clusterin-like protein 1 [Monodelphis domestica]|uniref:clusterin-like protein 1 n=1 Tax=Monodelphis domestica TaxID=13616 RepID=UPI0024E19AD7|nr:clusterin-like protein 1 [Monodelphis domestica]